MAEETAKNNERLFCGVRRDAELVSTEREGGNLVFVYADKGGKEIREVYPIKKGGKDTLVLGYIDGVDIFDKPQKYIVVDATKTQQYIKGKLEREDYNFLHHIFLGDVDFSGARFSEKSNFSYATFTEKAFFSRATFTKEAYFLDTTFTKEANFFDTTFIKEAYFSLVTFSAGAYFSLATFYAEADFHYTTFIKEANFSDATFSKEANFFDATFSGAKALFHFATFEGRAIFVDIVCEKGADKKPAILDFTNASFYKEFKLQLTEKTNEKRDKNGNLIKDAEKITHSLDLDLANMYVQSGYFHFNTLLIETVKKSAESPRETYTRLKDALIARHDTVSALEMHKKEYDTYYESARWHRYIPLPKSLQDVGTFFVLDFEKTVSNFGTSVFRSLSAWAVVWGVFGFCMVAIYYNETVSMDGVVAERVWHHILTDNSETARKIVSYAFQPISLFLRNDFLVQESDTPWRILEVLNFLKTILLAAITYEVIKSFRKYSRRF